MLVTMKFPLKIVDILIISLAFGFTVFTVFAAYIKPQGQAFIVIQGQGSEWTFPLDANETVIVPGQLGDTIIKIHENTAWVESSPCQNQTCVTSGYVWRQGQWAACLPNNVLLIIKGDNEQDIDAVAW
jgi:hypothetical protein